MFGLQNGSLTQLLDRLQSICLLWILFGTHAKMLHAVFLQYFCSDTILASLSAHGKRRFIHTAHAAKAMRWRID